MRKLEELIRKAFSQNTPPYYEKWYVRRTKASKVIRITIDFYPYGILHEKGRLLSFTTNLIGQQDIDDACNFIEIHLNK